MFVDMVHYLVRVYSDPFSSLRKPPAWRSRKIQWGRVAELDHKWLEVVRRVSVWSRGNRNVIL